MFNFFSNLEDDSEEFNSRSFSSTNKKVNFQDQNNKNFPGTAKNNLELFQYDNIQDQSKKERLNFIENISILNKIQDKKKGIFERDSLNLSDNFSRDGNKKYFKQKRINLYSP